MTFNLKSRRTKIILALAGVSAASLFYIYSSTTPSLNGTSPTPTPTPQAIPPRDSKLNQLPQTKMIIASNVTFPNIPTTLPVYTAAPLPDKGFEISTVMANIFKLTPVTDAPNYWTSEKPSQLIRYDKDGKFIEYKLDSFDNPTAFTGPKRPTPNEAIAKATQFITSLPDLPTLSALKDNVVFQNLDGPHPEISTQDDYDLITVNFLPFIEGYPVYASNEISPTAFVSLGQNNQIVSVTINLNNVAPATHQSIIDTKTVSQLTEEITNGKMTPLDAGIISPQQIQSPDFPGITITNIEVEYRLQSDRTTLAPYLRVIGHYNFPDFPTETISFITPLKKS